MSKVRERVLEGKGVRVPLLAEEVGLPPSTIYALIKAGKIEAIRIGRSVVVPSHAARPLLGIADPIPQAA